MDTISKANQQIIGQIYQETRTELFSIFRQACIAEDTCEDLVQDVFIKILSLDVIIVPQLKALAVNIAYNKRIDYLRHKSFIDKVKNDMVDWHMEKGYTNQELEINEILNAEMKVIHCMSKLDEKAYCLSRFDEKTADEIAMTLNLSKRAVESRLYRTRKMVRENLRKAVGFNDL